MHRESQPDSIQGITQAGRAVLALRDMIVSGVLEDGARYTEVQLAAMLSMSRTPIRSALQRLTDEGMLVPMAAGGYTVRGFLPEEIFEAIEIRGMLEGLCVRLLAERERDEVMLARLVLIADRIEAVLLADRFTQASIVSYAQLNAEFHQTLLDACGSQLLQHEVARANARPFGSASALVGMHEPDQAARMHLWVGQDQHRAVIEAIGSRQGGRAEQIMREHARLSQRNLSRALETKRPLEGIQGGKLIRREREAEA